MKRLGADGRLRPRRKLSAIVHLSLSGNSAVIYVVLSLALPLVTAVGIAFSQHRVLGRHRRADRQADAERIKQEQLQQARRDRRASWGSAFKDADEILKRLQDIESEVRAQGPVDPDFVSRAELNRIRWQLENVADLCPDVLRSPLMAVASRVAILSGVRFPSDADVMNGYIKALASTPPDPLPQEITASHLGARAVEQYSAAVDLHEAITSVMKAIQTERGGEN